ncbi:MULTISPECIES: hypothetical protein [Dactylosporangium]|uniref:Uncharacterized protein n=2 Tax=Dactylosporangium TaxID=35753 RepID=A0A9W6KPQ0_9ACTN|nr:MULTISPECIES: hypothetical protein [Dactylosporangium]UAB95078.1 hypothetical protein Dvina_44670 [Dactylosporangium vinaceum]UWZ43444.1 hypothetical protein Dmats_39265 [Dactylosporangium matsuzakiense]GLL05837.1 hypothetical protein GCM10017581_075850 [Dactylosporangium matsuzakiense]
MLVDCESCTVRGKSCSSCVVTLLLDTPQAFHQLGPEEVNAIEVFELAGFEVTVLEPTHFETIPVTPIPTPRRRNGRAA